MKVLSNTTSVNKNTLVRLILTKSRLLEVAANMGGLTGQITYGIDSVTSNINLFIKYAVAMLFSNISQYKYVFLQYAYIAYIYIGILNVYYTSAIC